MKRTQPTPKFSVKETKTKSWAVFGGNPLRYNTAAWKDRAVWSFASELRSYHLSDYLRALPIPPLRSTGVKLAGDIRVREDVVASASSGRCGRTVGKDT